MGNKYETDLNPTSLETVYPKDFLDVVKKYDLRHLSTDKKKYLYDWLRYYDSDWSNLSLELFFQIEAIRFSETTKTWNDFDDFGHNDTIDINELFKDNSEIVSNDVSMIDMLHEMNDRIKSLESEVKKLEDIINNK